MGVKAHPEHVRQAALAEYAETSLSIEKISRKHGVSQSALRKWIKAEGYDLARRIKTAAARADRDSPNMLNPDAWVYGRDGVARYIGYDEERAFSCP